MIAMEITAEVAMETTADPMRWRGMNSAEPFSLEKILEKSAGIEKRIGADDGPDRALIRRTLDLRRRRRIRDPDPNRVMVIATETRQIETGTEMRDQLQTDMTKNATTETTTTNTTIPTDKGDGTPLPTTFPHRHPIHRPVRRTRRRPTNPPK